VRDLLLQTADLAADFLESVPDRPVFPRVGPEELRARLGGPVPEDPTDPSSVVADLAAVGSDGAVLIPGGRYFGFVIGGSVPAALAADWLTSTWDQNAGLYVGGPTASIVEEVAGAWLADLLRIPRAKSFAFVTGTQMAHATAMAAARNHVLAEVGWDVEEKGLTGAPRIRVFAGEKAHSTFPRALRLIGLGTGSITAIPADDQARMRADALREALAGNDGPAIVCAKAGEVNTGSFDPFEEIADAAEEAGAWLHVDGAFGLWAAAAPGLRDRIVGLDLADSWTTDSHKWLNVPYDSGLVFVRDAAAHRTAMTLGAAYYVETEGAERDPYNWVAESSRRARGFTVYAALRSFGRAGLAALIEGCCAHARRFEMLLAGRPGVTILNDVVLNQVLVRFTPPVAAATDGATVDAFTKDVIARVQADGTCWLGGTVWHGMSAMRISVSSWATTEADVELSAEAILRCAREAAEALRGATPV
jgi:glutamate/tyrosine decarboxylase-like PLP-dependent enzyme